MFSTHVALVPYEPDSVPTEELLHVASALQTQLTRDLGPFWDITGVLSPFLRLEHVPPRYVPLAIVPGLPEPWHGFHIVSDGTPVALIGYRRGWPFLASHELVELVCDPWGNRTLSARSLLDDQGRVEYLVEVCDPCQAAHYTFHDVHLSDFVTPEYYQPHSAKGGRYSFTGSIERPLEVPAGGLLSWRTPSGQIWQKSGSGQPEPLDRTTFSRASLHSYGTGGQRDVIDGLSQPNRTRKPYYKLERSAQTYGSRLKTSIDRVLEQLEVKPPKASLDAIVKLLEELAIDGHPTRQAYAADPVKTLRLKRFSLDPPDQLAPLAPADTYRGVLAALDGGLGVGDPRLAAWLSTHAAFFPAGVW